MAQILCVRPRKMFMPIFSWLIRWVENKPYSHMAIWNVADEIIDATAKGVCTNEAKAFLEHYETIHAYEIPDISEDRYNLFKSMYLGRGYSIRQNIGFFLKIIGVHKRNIWGDGEKKLVCSELAALFTMFSINKDILDSDQYDLVVTEDLLVKYGQKI